MTGLRSLALGAAVLGGLALGVPTQAFSGHHKGGERKLERLERALEKLDLDAKTEETVQGVIDQAREEQRALEPQMREAHQTLRELMDADAPDEQAVLAQAEKLGALQTQAQQQRLRTRLRVQALLTPEQREALASDWKEHRKGRHGKGGCSEHDAKDAE